MEPQPPLAAVRLATLVSDGELTAALRSRAHCAFTLSSLVTFACHNERLERAMTVWTRIKLAFAAFFSILFKGRLPAVLQPAAHAEAPAQPIAADTSDRAVQMLALLQREGRLIDFVLEDLAAYSDAQIGAAARDVHSGCHRVLERYVTLEAILPGREGEGVTVGQDQQIDPAAFHLVGNVAG